LTENDGGSKDLSLPEERERKAVMLKFVASSFFSFLQLLHVLTAIALVAFVAFVAIGGRDYIIKNDLEAGLPPIVDAHGNTLVDSSAFDEQLALQTPVTGTHAEDQIARFISYGAHHWLALLGFALKALLGACVWWQVRASLYGSDLSARLRTLSRLFLAIFVVDLAASFLAATSFLPLFRAYTVAMSDLWLNTTFLDAVKFDPAHFLIPHFSGATALALALVTSLFARRLRELADLRAESALVI
jgi:hypothetical protein